MGCPLYVWKPSVVMLAIIPEPGTKTPNPKPRISPEITVGAVTVKTVVINGQPDMLNTVTNLERPS